MNDGWVGRSPRRREDDRLIRGAGRFVGDVRYPDEAHVTFVRSLVSHARIGGIDSTRARAHAGVIDVLTADDLPKGPMPPFLWDSPPEKLVRHLRPTMRPCHPPLLADGRSLFVGQAVAVVIADGRARAEDAAALVDVDYEPLPPVPTLEAALRPDAAILHDGWDDNVAVRFTVRAGDVEAAFASAEVVIEDRFEIQRQAGLPLEGRAAVAIHDERDGLLLWSATQNAHPLRRALSRVSGLAERQIRVVAPDVGGGFGVKGVLYPEDLIVGLLAIRLGRPVKWIEDRVEHMQSAIHAREQAHDVRLALAADGTILALGDRFVVDAGAYNPLGLVVPYNTIAHLMGPYRVPAFDAVGSAVVTTKVPTAPYRGAGRPEAVFAVERALERGAAALGIDPIELRRRNLLRADEMPHPLGILYRDGEPAVLDGGDFPELLRRASALVEEEDAVAERDDEARRGRLVGVGVAAYVEATGIGPFEGAAVALAPSGAVSVRTGACAQGQGHETVLSQVCADALGIDPDAISVTVGDTQGLDRGWGTVASRSTVVAGNAVAAAAARVRDRVLDAAAEMLEASPSDVVLDRDRVSVAGAADRHVTVAELAERGVDLGAVEYYEPPTVTWAGGVHAVSVSVDRETGEVRVLRYAVAHDCGPLVHPVIVEGQIHGGVAQGIAGALYEEVVYDDQAQLLNATLADYLVPTAAEVPPVLLEHLETPSSLNPLGLKGMGEGGAIPAPAAIANAVERAIGGGVVVRRTPLSPAFVRALVEQRAAED